MKSPLHARHSLSAATVALSSAAVLLVAAPAQAGVWSYPDSAGDGARAIDIAHVRVANTRRAVTVKTTFQDLNRSRLGAAYVVLDTGRAYGEGHFVGVQRRHGRLVHPRIVYRSTIDSDARARRIRCAGLRYRWRSGGHFNEWLAIRVPHRCLRHSGRVRANVYTYNRSGRSYDTAPETRSGYSRWVRRG